MVQFSINLVLETLINLKKACLFNNILLYLLSKSSL